MKPHCSLCLLFALLACRPGPVRSAEPLSENPAPAARSAASAAILPAPEAPETRAAVPLAQRAEAFDTPSTAERPARDLLVVDFFLRNRMVPLPYVEALRADVVHAFAERNRQELLDAECSRAFAETLPGTGLTTPETAEADLAAFLEMRAPEALAAGARYLVGGAVCDYRFRHTQLPSGDSRKPPVKGYESTFRVIVAALDLRLGKVLPVQTYELKGSARIAEDADRAALQRIRGSLDFFVSTQFRIETRILELCPPDKKGRFRELYVHSGSQTGARVGDLFQVYEEVSIGGVAARRKIGRLRVKNAENPEVALCKIAKGDAEIADAFLAGRELICVSDGKAFGY